MPAGLRNAQVKSYSACRSAFSSFWLTTFVTPSACMDTPNSISAISMVRRWCVIMMSCVVSRSVSRYIVRRRRFESSSAASTSSRM